MKKITYSFYFLLLFTFLTTTGEALANNLHNNFNDTLRVLTIGNSFAGNATKYLEEITASVDGVEIIIGRANIGGCDLEKHANLIKQCELDPALKPYKGKTLKEWLLKDNWDVVTIQQVSHLSFKSESYQPYADEIRNHIKEHAPQAKIYIHETWAYGPDCDSYKGFGITSDEMHVGLKKNYDNLAKLYNAPILSSGDAFYLAYNKKANIDLWNAKDRSHANENGCYLAACVWFAKLFGKSTKKIKYRPDEIPKKTARYLRRIAAK